MNLIAKEIRTFFYFITMIVLLKFQNTVLSITLFWMYILLEIYVSKSFERKFSFYRIMLFILIGISNIIFFTGIIGNFKYYSISIAYILFYTQYILLFKEYNNQIFIKEKNEINIIDVDHFIITMIFIVIINDAYYSYFLSSSFSLIIKFIVIFWPTMSYIYLELLFIKKYKNNIN